MPEGRYERRDLPYRQVTIFLVAVPVLVGAGLAGATLVPGALTGDDAGPPVPRPEDTNGRTFQDQRADEAEALRGFGWVNREKGTVRVPIDRAIDLFLEAESKR